MGIEVQIAMFIFSTAYQYSQQKKQEAKMKAEADKRKGFEITVRGKAEHIPVVYGRQKLGGIETKHIVRNSLTNATSNADQVLASGLGTSHSGSKNEILLVQYALCHDGIQSVKHIIVNDKDYNDSEAKYNHRFSIHTTGGKADAMGVANGVPASNLFTGTANVTAAFKLNRDDYNYNGVPYMGFLVEGRKVRKITKSGSTYTLNSTYVYSNNPAYCLLDYLMNDKFGRGLTVNEVDLESFYHAAQVCDTVVATDKSVGGNIWDVTTRDIPLYECNITLDTEDSIRNNVERIMNTMGLAELVWSPAGKYRLLLEYPRNLTEQNALITADNTFTEDDVLRESVGLAWPSAADRYNQVTVRFNNEHEDFKEDSVSWPTKFSATHNVYLSEDNNQPFTTDMYLDGCTDPYHALAKAEQIVRQSRTRFNLSLTVTKKGLRLEPGDFIKLTLPQMAINQEIFRVASVQVNSDFSVKLECYSFSYNMLVWSVNQNIPYTTKPTFDFTVSPPTNVAFTKDAGTILGTRSGQVTWDDADDSSVKEYLVEVSPDNEVTWFTLGITRNTSFDVFGLDTGVYSFSVRSRTPVGTLSDRVTTGNTTLQLITVDKVAVIYADSDNFLTNTQSYSVGTNKFIAYYTYNSDLPTLPIRSGITFTQFVGDDGAPGQPGTNGTNGTSSGVLVVYADDATGTNKTFTYNGQEYVLYYEWTGAAPALVDITGTWTKFIGANGTNGQSVWPIYDADGTGNNQSFVYNGQPYVTFYESVTQPTLPVSGQTFVKFKGDDGYTPVKGVDYDDGASATSVAQIQIYKRATSTPTTPTGGSFNFATSTTVAPNGWSTVIPTGTDPTYVSVGVASVVGTSGTDSSITWSAPALAFRVGDDGATGKSTFLGTVYKRASTAPSGSVSGGSFNFGTNLLTPPTGWSVTPPTGTTPLYAMQYLFSINGDQGTDSVVSPETWSNPVEIVRNGSDGYTPVKGTDYFDGDDGKSTYQLTLFRRSSTTITTAPSGGSYSFATNSMTNIPSGWYTTPPSGSDPMYISTALATATGPTGVDSSLTWTTPTLFVQNGAPGATGGTGPSGPRGAGWWRYQTGTSAGVAGLSASTLGTYFNNATNGLAIVAGDRLIVANTVGDATGYVRNGTNTAWVEQAEFIDGNLLVAGTIESEALKATTLSAIKADLGTIKAGKLQNPNGTFVIDLTSGTITISV